MAFVGQGQAQYDRAITIFSPDGKLFQVQYAQEAVKRGRTALGIKVQDGVILAAERGFSDGLAEERSIEKIFQVDAHLGATASGLIADARVLMERARIEAQVNRMRYDEPIPVQTLARTIGDIKQAYTQHGGVRPFGTRFLIGGVGDNGPHLFETDPSGVVAAYKAHAIGGGAESAIEVLEDGYDKASSMDEAILLALRALKAVVGEEFKVDLVEMAKIESEKREFQVLTKDELSEHIKKLGS